MAKATDAARRLAAELEIDLRGVEGSGRGGSVTVADVRAAQEIEEERAGPTGPKPDETTVLGPEEPGDTWSCPESCGTRYSKLHPEHAARARNHMRRTHNIGWNPGRVGIEEA